MRVQRYTDLPQMWCYTVASSRIETRNTDLGFLVDGNNWMRSGFKQS
jgi:hypothetical protein